VIRWRWSSTTSPALLFVIPEQRRGNICSSLASSDIQVRGSQGGMMAMIDRRHCIWAWPSRRGSWPSVIIISGFFLAISPSGANAQINPFRGYKGPTLSKEDIAAGRAAAEKLLAEDQAQVGKSEGWTGPTSGNKGNISVQKEFQRQGMQCRALRSEVRFAKPSAQPRTINLNVCRVHGEWKLM
jgi:hypothetical protein